MTQAVQNQNTQQLDLLKTSLPISPVAAVFNIDNYMVENFLMDLFAKKKGITGINAVRMNVKREGSERAIVNVYLFIDLKSDHVISGLSKVPQHLQDKVELGGLRASDTLFRAVRPLMDGDFKMHAKPGRGMAYIMLDIFKVIGAMLGVDPSRHRINIMEAKQVTKKESVVSVMKRVKFIDKAGAGDSDVYNSIIDEIED